MKAFIRRLRGDYDRHWLLVMIAWIRWQIACLADDYRCVLRRLWRRWWYGKPGRHGAWQDYTTGQMAAIEDDLASRPWPLDAAPALSNIPPVPGPELPQDDPPWVAEAELRGNSPHLFAPDADYWAWAWSKFRDDATESLAWDEAEANKTRRECGLPPRPLAPHQIRELKAA